MKIGRAALIAAGITLLPLCASAFVEDWHWGPSGFLVFGAFVFIAALGYQAVANNANSRAYKFAAGLAVTTTFILMWTNFVLAADANTANLIFLCVVPIGIIGAVIARLKPRGMALTLAGMTIAQLLLIVSNPSAALGAVPVIGLNGVYAVLFGASALLFRHSETTAL